MTPRERLLALQGFARLVCEVEAMAYDRIVKELSARNAWMATRLEQPEAVGRPEGLAGQGKLVGEGADT